MLDIKKFNENKNILSSRAGDINIDSVMIENAGTTDSLFYKEEGLHKLHSCSKILVAMAVGVAIHNKMVVDSAPLSLETKIYPIIKNLVHIKSKENIKKIEQWKLKNLLTHTTGYEKQMMSERFIQDVNKEKLLEYALNYNIPNEVGTRYAYNNVEPFIISVIFQEAFNINLSDYINEHIFKKLEITNYVWENYGMYCIAASGLQLKHSDFHKIGQLILYRGKYKDIQVIPSAWIDEMCTMHIKTTSEYKPERLFPKIDAGYFTFISRDRYVFRDGSDGQYLIINKPNNLLISILSSEPNVKNVTEILRGLL